MDKDTTWVKSLVSTFGRNHHDPLRIMIFQSDQGEGRFNVEAQVAQLLVMFVILKQLCRTARCMIHTKVQLTTNVWEYFFYIQFSWNVQEKISWSMIRLVCVLQNVPWDSKTEKARNDRKRNLLQLAYTKRCSRKAWKMKSDQNDKLLGWNI